MGDGGQGPFNAPMDRAIVVGIDHYRPGIQTLQGAINDAKLFQKWLIDPDGGGLDPDHVRVITSRADSEDFRPQRDQIEDEILKFYAQRRQKAGPVGRRLYLFFSGHGAAPRDGDECGLLMANSDVASAVLRALPGRLSSDRVLRSALFEETVLLMDCCRDVTGTIDAFSGLPQYEETLPNASFLHGLAAKWKATAAEKFLPNPLDEAEPPLWQGVFTHAVLKGLLNATDDNGDVTSASLKKFVPRAVQDLLEPGDNRRPVIHIEEERLIKFGRARNSSKSP